MNVNTRECLGYWAKTLGVSTAELKPLALDRIDGNPACEICGGSTTSGGGKSMKCIFVTHLPSPMRL